MLDEWQHEKCHGPAKPLRMHCRGTPTKIQRGTKLITSINVLTIFKTGQSHGANLEILTLSIKFALTSFQRSLITAFE